jgi:hypothetical protein
VRRGERMVVRDGGRQVNVWKGVEEPAGHFIIGGVPFLAAFSTTMYS